MVAYVCAYEYRDTAGGKQSTYENGTAKKPGLLRNSHTKNSHMVVNIQYSTVQYSVE